MRTFLINIVTTTISVIVCVGIIEAGLRIYYYGSLTPFIGGPKLYRPDRQVGFSLNPNLNSSQQRVAFIVPVTTNSLGLRGPEPGDKAGRFRIAVLGDSHTFGSGLRDEETLPARLELELNAQSGSNIFQVVNAGSPAHSTVQELIQIRRLAPKMDADLWILAFTPENDIQYNTAELRRQMTRGPRRPVADIAADGTLTFDYAGAERYFRKNSWRLEGPLQDRPWYENTALYQRGKIAWKSFGGPQDYDPNIVFGRPFQSEFLVSDASDRPTAAEYEALWAHGWHVTQRLIEEIKSEAEKSESRFAMISMPADIQVMKSKQEAALKQFPELKFDLQRGNRELAALGAERRIPVFDILTPLLKARDAGQTDLHYTLFDSHMKPLAHRIMAKSLARDLLASGLLPEN
ncbi:MAG: hypothetical protein AAF441_01050 [Pseudomonadota bacterium]